MYGLGAQQMILPQEVSSLLTEYAVLKQIYDKTPKQEQTTEQFEKLDKLFTRINILLGNNSVSKKVIIRIEDSDMKSVTKRTAKLNVSNKTKDT